MQDTRTLIQQTQWKN